MEDHCSTQQLKRAEPTEASTPTISKRPKPDVPSASGVNSDPSASSTSVNGNNYYVFLSFRGSDTRNGFVDHLYYKLKEAGLPFHPNFVFRDDKDLPFGEDIDANLISVIKHSKVSIPVISENYAASEWCLRELIQIMECKKSIGQIVLPVLYKVKPSDVEKLEGAFGKAFDDHKDTFEEWVKQRGPEALKKAVENRVFESENIAGGREAELVKELVREIMDKRQQDFLPPLPRNLVGIDDRVAEVMKLVDTAPSETRIIGICGIGGIGKTTLAKNIYNELAKKKFDCHSFLLDIRETINRNGMEHIQNQLISDIGGDQGRSVPDSVRGIAHIQFVCENNKVLILLDDVGHRDHLDKLIGGCKFGLGSRIIITCRDKALLKSEYKCYELKEMDDKYSMLLFCSHAFGVKQPPTELVTLSKAIVATIGGLPLALEIIGSFLKGKDISIWKETQDKLKKVPPTDVQKKLRLSYDSLEYEEQQMFLDIACFFIGIKRRFAAYLWKDLQYCLDSGLKRMIELSLMKIDDNDELRMHDQLRDLGRAIACPANKKPWKCSRLWDEKAIIVQRSKEKNRNIEALHLDENGSNMFLNRRSFKRMAYLKFLHLSNVHLDGNFKDSLSELRWLEWQNCPNSFEATNVHLEKLLILDLSNGYISQEWGGWSSIRMERLKVLNLSRCVALKTTPNLSVFKSLEMLILEECENLEEIDPSIGNVKCLISLNLRGCHHLQELPSQLGELRSLVSLNLAYCKELLELPKEMGKLKNLKELTINGLKIKKIPRLGSLKKLETLNAQWTSLIELPNSISHLVNLSTLDLRFCSDFEGFPKSIGSLVKLQRLLVGNKILPSENDWGYDWRSSDSYCFSHIPRSIGNLESLTELYLTCTKISKLPKSIGKLKNLKILDIAGCENLSSLPNTISKLGKLEELDATACESLEGGVAINGLSSLKILRLGKLGYTADLLEMYDMDLLSLDNVDYLSFQDHLNLTNCNFPASLTVLKVTCHNHNLPQLSHLIHLKELSFQFCEFLESIPELPSGILNLWVVFCGELKRLPSLLRLELLSELHIIGCSKLKKIEGLEGLKSLRGLSICTCEKLHNLYGLEHLEYLRELKIEELDASIMNDYLFQVQCLGRLKNLETLHITRCENLTRLDISQLINLEVLLVYECEDVDIIKGLERLKKLRCLNIKGCKSISKLHIIGCGELMEVEGLEGLKSLRRLFLCECKKLRNLGGLKHLDSLTYLNIEGCKSITKLPGLGGLTKLTYLNIKGCKSIRKLPDLSPLKNLGQLDIRECSNLQDVGLERSVVVLR